ncbi:testis-specific serine/threonine-protein kinase 3-like [Tachypleus tridentatus]|uniref:testis-specific serine/threonine-protein kinase 3-like n=1 Tax=Tachypleus tridentatus TaxID=6853 RepID=UPI003FD20637
MDEHIELKDAPLRGNDSYGSVEVEQKQTVLESYGYEYGNRPTLGRGSYAIVRVADSSQHRREVAIKIISKRKAPPEYIEKFLPREINVIRILRHSNIIRFLQMIETMHRVYIVMELATNGDLLQMIKKDHIIEERRACKWFHNLVDGISYCHEKGVVHRDLKCENLLLDNYYVLKITDFGFAKVVDGVNLQAIKSMPEHALSTTFCGSYAYAPPEILKGIPYIPHLADIWSMGVILYIMVFGKFPFNDSDHRKLLQQVQKPVEFPPSPLVSSEVNGFINKLLVSASDRAYVEDIRRDPWYKYALTAKRPGCTAVSQAIHSNLDSKSERDKTQERS